MLSDAITATDYREGYTEKKKSKGERFTHPRWRDPEYVSTGLAQPPEASWASTQRDYGPLKKTKETVPYDNQHRARFSKPFSVHPQVEKQTTSFRSDFKDHIACKDDQPEYWKDMVVRIPPGSAVAGNIRGNGPPPYTLDG
jgi:hypothetical protein